MSCISCTTCDVFGENPVKLEGNEDIVLVSCGACHRSYFRPDEDSFVWIGITAEARQNMEKNNIENVWI